MKKIIIACSMLAIGSAVTVRAQTPVPAPAGRGGGVAQPGLRVNGLVLEGRVVKGQPYSAEIVSESTQALADGNRIVQRTTGRVYRDSEGRIRREEDRASGGPTISITDVVAGTTFTLDPSTRTARQSPAKVALELTQAVGQLAGQLGALRSRVADGWTAGLSWNDGALIATRVPGGRGGRGGEELLEEKLQDRVIEGVVATGIRRTTTIAKGAIGNEQPIRIVSEEWTSPELQVLVMTDHNDPRSGRSTYRLLRVNRVDPDATLFQVPPDYTVQRFGLGGAGGAGGRGGRGQ